MGTPTIAQVYANTALPAQLAIDYVRVYNVTAPLHFNTQLVGGKIQFTWPTNVVCHLESTPSLTSPVLWTKLTNATSPYAPPSGPSEFYRLVSP